MYGQGPTTGSVMVAGLTGLATGLLVAALLIAGREPEPRAYETGSIPSETTNSQSAGPVTVTVEGVVPPPLTLTKVATPAPRTVTQTVTTPPSSTTSPTTSTVLPPSAGHPPNPEAWRQ